MLTTSMIVRDYYTKLNSSIVSTRCVALDCLIQTSRIRGTDEDICMETLPNGELTLVYGKLWFAVAAGNQKGFNLKMAENEYARYKMIWSRVNLTPCKKSRVEKKTSEASENDRVGEQCLVICVSRLDRWDAWSNFFVIKITIWARNEESRFCTDKCFLINRQLPSILRDLTHYRFKIRSSSMSVCSSCRRLLWTFKEKGGTAFSVLRAFHIVKRLLLSMVGEEGALAHSTWRRWQLLIWRDNARRTLTKKKRKGKWKKKVLERGKIGSEFNERKRKRDVEAERQKERGVGGYSLLLHSGS